MNTPRLSALSMAFAATLAACGGGGGDGDSAAPSPPPASTPAPPNANVVGEIVVQLNTGNDINAIATAYQLSVVDQFGKRPIWRLRTAGGAAADDTIASLRNDPRVRFAEANVENETPEGRRRSLWAAGGDAGTYATQWAPAALRLPEAHATSLGTGMRVAVLDTGLDLAHPAFTSRLARNNAGALLGRDFVDDDADPSEVGAGTDPGYGHGTHVAGLVSLVAPQATLMPARVLDRAGRGNVWVLSEALAWALDPDANPASDDGAHVINLSLGTTQTTNLLRTAVALANCDFDDDDDEFEDPGFDDDRTRCANKFGAVVLAAAGNDGSDTQQQFPRSRSGAGLVVGNGPHGAAHARIVRQLRLLGRSRRARRQDHQHLPRRRLRHLERHLDGRTAGGRHRRAGARHLCRSAQRAAAGRGAAPARAHRAAVRHDLPRDRCGAAATDTQAPEPPCP